MITAVSTFSVHALHTGYLSLVGICHLVFDFSARTIPRTTMSSGTIPALALAAANILVIKTLNTVVTEPYMVCAPAANSAG